MYQDQQHIIPVGRIRLAEGRIRSAIRLLDPETRGNRLLNGLGCGIRDIDAANGVGVYARRRGYTQIKNRVVVKVADVDFDREHGRIRIRCCLKDCDTIVHSVEYYDYFEGINSKESLKSYFDNKEKLFGRYLMKEMDPHFRYFIECALADDPKEIPYPRASIRH